MAFIIEKLQYLPQRKAEATNEVHATISNPLLPNKGTCIKSLKYWTAKLHNQYTNCFKIWVLNKKIWILNMY